MSNNKSSHKAARGLSDGLKVGLLSNYRNGRSHPRQLPVTSLQHGIPNICPLGTPLSVSTMYSPVHTPQRCSRVIVMELVLPPSNWFLKF